MADFYPEVSKLRNNIENEIINVMNENGLTSFSFSNPISVSNNEDDGDGKVYEIALDVNDDNGWTNLTLFSSWNGFGYDDAESYLTTDFYVEDLLDVYQILLMEINERKS